MSNELKPLHFDADYTMEEALAEAKRCLNCPKPLCRMGCPIENEIPRFIQAIAVVILVKLMISWRNEQIYRLSAVACAHEKINAKATVS